MWQENEVVMRDIGSSKLERYRREAEIARVLPSRPLRWQLAATLRRLADRLEPAPQLTRPQSARV